jgi:hypothetical protein
MKESMHGKIDKLSNELESKNKSIIPEEDEERANNIVAVTLEEREAETEVKLCAVH